MAVLALLGVAGVALVLVVLAISGSGPALGVLGTGAIVLLLFAIGPSRRKK